MLNFACTAKARKRTVTLTRPSRDDPLQVEDNDDGDDDDEDDDDGVDDDEIMMARLMMTKMVKLNPFQFNIVGGYEKGFGIFISKVEPGSKVKDFI